MKTNLAGIWVVEIWKEGRFLERVVFDDPTAAGSYAHDARKCGWQVYDWKLY